MDHLIFAKIPQEEKHRGEKMIKEIQERKTGAKTNITAHMWLALTGNMLQPKILKFKGGGGGIDWVICMCCERSWNVSRNLCWWMCLWPDSQPARTRLGAGNALTASRLPAWHQNRWMPLIVTVCNVFSSIIPFLLLSFSHTTSLSLAHGGSLMKISERWKELYWMYVVLFITLGGLSWNSMKYSCCVYCMSLCVLNE